MGGSATPSVNPFSRPPSSHQSPPAFTPSVSSLRTPSEDSCDPVIAKYPYLYAAHKQRPKVYQSPYAAEGGFTTVYLPNETLPPSDAPKNCSLSEDFLLKRTLSQQELLRNHKRKMSEDKIRHQQDQPQVSQPDQQKTQTTAATTSPQPSFPHQPGQSSFYPPQNYQYDYPHPYHNPVHPPPQYSLYDSSSPTLSHQQKQAGLQFQSQHDFQMQMQREAQQQEWTRAQAGGLGVLVRGLRSAACSTMNAHSSGSGGTQGSPLKYEMESGGEMLPMMRDRF